MCSILESFLEKCKQNHLERNRYKLQLMIAWELKPKSVIALIKYKFNDSLRSQLKTI